MCQTTLNITDMDKLNLVKLGNGGLVSGSSQFLLLPQLPQKMILPSKKGKGGSKIIILHCYSKSVVPNRGAAEPLGDAKSSRGAAEPLGDAKSSRGAANL